MRLLRRLLCVLGIHDDRYTSDCVRDLSVKCQRCGRKLIGGDRY